MFVVRSTSGGWIVSAIRSGKVLIVTCLLLLATVVVVRIVCSLMMGRTRFITKRASV